MLVGGGLSFIQQTATKQDGGNEDGDGWGWGGVTDHDLSMQFIFAI